jgi:hypothetical protein
VSIKPVGIVTTPAYEDPSDVIILEYAGNMARDEIGLTVLVKFEESPREQPKTLERLVAKRPGDARRCLPCRDRCRRVPPRPRVTTNPRHNPTRQAAIQPKGKWELLLKRPGDIQLCTRKRTQ